MRLACVEGGRLVCLDGLAVLAERPDGTMARASRLPAPSPRRDGPRRWARLASTPRRLATAVVGDYPVTNLWCLGDHRLATVGPRLYRAGADGRWVHSHQLPASSSTRGLLPSSVCAHDGAVYLGEYPLATDATPRVLRSTDRGRSWEPVLALPDVRHVHAVQHDPYGGDLWVTTGDADGECRIGRLRDGNLEVVGGGSQRWRAVELAFAPEAVLWGMDCGYAADNELLRLDRDDLEDPRPAPTVVGSAPGSVYHAATLAVDGTTWVAVSTAGEVGGDRTAPDDGTGDEAAGTRAATPAGDGATAGTAARAGGDPAGRPTGDEPTGPTVLAAAASTGFTEWHRLAAFERRRCLADIFDAGGHVPRANAYAFLAADDDRGLLVNPYNAVPGDGTIIRIRSDRFRSLADGSAPGGQRVARREP